MLCLAAACGDETVNMGDGDGGTTNGDGGPNGADGSPSDPDSGSGGCSAADTQCNNCIDDDGDGDIDGADIHCISAADNDESSFATGIPGDNMDTVKQDCFFDGDSGAGNDGCDLHICCLLDTMGTGDCPPEFSSPPYNPANCTQSQQCIDVCGALTPPGCDCFSCCTLCNDAGCFDVVTHPLVAPDCDVNVLDDPNLCPRCTKVEECSTDCEPTGCILCPGQSEEDLPPECAGNECPDDLTVCDTTADCGPSEFCNNGCCIIQID